jgi:hypothetical protein
LLSAAIVEELEPVWVCCGWRKPPTTHSHLFLIKWMWQYARCKGENLKTFFCGAVSYLRIFAFEGVSWKISRAKSKRWLCCLEGLMIRFVKGLSDKAGFRNFLFPASNFGFYRRREIYWRTGTLLDSQRGLRCVKLIHNK